MGRALGVRDTFCECTRTESRIVGFSTPLTLSRSCIPLSRIFKIKLENSGKKRCWNTKYAARHVKTKEIIRSKK